MSRISADDIIEEANRRLRMTSPTTPLWATDPNNAPIIHALVGAICDVVNEALLEARREHDREMQESR